MGLDISTLLWVTLDTDGVAPRLGLELVIRVARVHRVTTQAGHLTSSVTSGDGQGVEVTPGDSHGPIAPERIVEETWLLNEVFSEPAWWRLGEVLHDVPEALDARAR